MKNNIFPENANNQHEFIERRQKKDWVVRSVNVIAVIGWICALAAWLYIDKAKPETENFFTRWFNLKIRGYWDITLLRKSIGALLISFVTCVIGFFFNMSRHHRKTDRYNKSILILGAITFIMIIFFARKLI